MEDFTPSASGCSPLLIVAFVIVIAAGVWFASSLLTEQITANQATAAQAQAQIQHEQTQQTRIVEDAHTERWQSFLVAMRGAQADTADLWPIALLSVSLWAVVGYLALRDRRR